MILNVTLEVEIVLTLLIVLNNNYKTNTKIKRCRLLVDAFLVDALASVYTHSSIESCPVNRNTNKTLAVSNIR